MTKGFSPFMLFRSRSGKMNTGKMALICFCAVVFACGAVKFYMNPTGWIFTRIPPFPQGQLNENEVLTKGVAPIVELLTFSEVAELATPVYKRIKTVDYTMAQKSESEFYVNFIVTDKNDVRHEVTTYTTMDRIPSALRLDVSDENPRRWKIYTDGSEYKFEPGHEMYISIYSVLNTGVMEAMKDSIASNKWIEEKIRLGK